MSKKKATTVKGRGLWDFDTTPPTQVMTDRELDEYKRNGLPIPTYALDIPDSEMYANLYGTPTPIPTRPQLYATTTSTNIPAQLPNLHINPDMYFLNTIPIAERRAIELRNLEWGLRDLEREVKELKKPRRKASSKKKKRTKKRSVSKKKRRSKSK